MVGRLVEKEQVRLFQQNLGQFHAHLPAVAELAHGAQHVVVAETQSDQNPLRFTFDAVAAEQGQAVVQVVQLNYQLLVLWAFVVGALGQFLLQALYITFQLMVFIKSGKCFIQNGLRAVHVLLLRQIADGNALRDNDIAF